MFGYAVAGRGCAGGGGEAVLTTGDTGGGGAGLVFDITLGSLDRLSRPGAGEGEVVLATSVEVPSISARPPGGGGYAAAASSAMCETGA